MIENGMVLDYREEPRIIHQCECCSEDIFEGDTCYKYDGNVFCSKECFLDWMLEGDLIKTTAEIKEEY